MGSFKITPSNGGTVTLTSVVTSAGVAISLWTDVARTAALSLPATVGGTTVLYPAATFRGQLWFRATAPGGAVVTGSGRTGLPEYDVIRISDLDRPPVEAPVGPPDGSVVATRVIYGGTP
jgi:hypothetical protein